MDTHSCAEPVIHSYHELLQDLQVTVLHCRRVFVELGKDVRGLWTYLPGLPCRLLPRPTKGRHNITTSEGMEEENPFELLRTY